MTPEIVRAKRAALRLAGQRLRARPFDDTLATLCRVVDSWSDPGSAWRRALEIELPAATGFSTETVRSGLALALDAWSGDALAATARRELTESHEGAETTAVILGGSIPMPSLLSMLAPLVLRSPILAKCASRDRVTPRLVARSLIETDEELGECAFVLDLPSDQQDSIDEVLATECVVATGSDETLAALRMRMPDPKRLVGHGHRLSLAALGPEACGDDLAEHVDALALDIALWDQLGCLSPLAVYAPSAHATAVAAALAAALGALEARMPRGTIDARSAAAVSTERAEAELRAASGQATHVHASEGTAWTVVREAEPAVRPAPLHRFVRVYPVANGDDLLHAVAPYGRHLAGVALAGFGEQEVALTQRLHALGASRVCAPGRLQAPPLDWPRDGHRVLASLVAPPV